jgi:hypothetical protein
MQQSKLKLITFVLLSLFQGTVNAQETTDASGGNATGSGGSASYSIGQIVYTTHTGTNGSVAQGVQQPYEISVVTALEEAKDIALSFLVYPNPTYDFLKLKVENYISKNLSYLLYDISGKTIESKKIEGTEATIPMESLATGTYFLKVTEGNKDIKTFKIIKN